MDDGLEFVVSFKFHLGERVLNPFGDEAIVLMQGRDSGGIKYYTINQAGNGVWFDEEQLSVNLKPLTETK